ncbi:AAA domain-containing protein [Paraclostridium bifermentans]|uniref:AAA domain-containing protein n=1 Tax=Paraclostridium bifermentans TaxID=1490 RepID=A0AA44DKK7_PARBF|nr:AAA family ATPase [Paraclostridium bifermentans]NME09453.1 AAA domain-containing protein [Paraclostridium bifermentans]
MNKNEFQLWMDEVEGLAESTITGYIETIEKKLPQIYKIDNLELLKEKVDNYLSDPTVINENKVWKNKISSSMKKYVKFFEEKIIPNLNRNLIISGAPGTGKSYNLEEDRKKYFGDRYERVTFYSNYTYNQFVGTYKPKPKFDEKKEYISYELTPGPFLRILVKSINDKQNKPHLLIIEEINRANAANVFGDIFQLLDRRLDGRSQYGISISEDMKKYLDDNLDDKLFNDELYIPSNLYIWCTMNSADQGVYPMDTAFKRRFEFEFIGINEGQNIIQDINIKVLWQEDELKWNKLRVAINNKLRESRQVKEDKLIGPFFIGKSVLEGDSEKFNKSFKNKLLMYLYEDICKYDKLIIFDKDYCTFSELIEAYESGHKVLNINIESNQNNLSIPTDNNNLQ